MRVGTLIVDLRIDQARSLKEKRSVIRRLLESARQKFNVSGAEVGRLDSWQHATLGFAVVANDGRHCNRVLDSLLDHLESQGLAEVGGVEMEVL
jgi:uncharacterized protein YlxP (DUF503 family)